VSCIVGRVSAQEEFIDQPEDTTMKQLLLLIELLIIPVAAPSRARGDDASCKAVTEAMMKQLKTAYRQTITLDGKPAGEKMYTTTAFYYQGKDGHWIRVPMTTQERIDAMHETGATFSNCKQLREEMVDGQSATVYAVREQTTSPTQSIDTQIWIASASGLALKTEADLERNGRRMHVSTHFSYDHVQPPASVQ
jgi:hypothetical protein